MPKLSEHFVMSLLNSPDSFPVNFEYAWHLSGFLTERTARNKLLLLEAGLHYVAMKQIEEREVGGTIKTVFQLSLEGFKSLALLAQTHDGREVNRIISSAEMKWKNGMYQMYRDLGESLGNIKLALALLDDMPVRESYFRYWEILESECDRSVTLLERVPEPQHDVLPKNLRIRRNSIPVRFHLSKKAS